MEIQKGDKIAICGKNSSHWAVAFFGTLSYGAVAVSILHEFDKSSVEYIVDHSDAKVFFVDNALFQNLNMESMPQLETVVTLDSFSLEQTKSEELKSFFTNAEEYFKKMHFFEILLCIGKEAFQFFGLSLFKGETV